MLEVGSAFSVVRTFTVDEVRFFAELSRDEGFHHMEPDEQGRLMVHGLMTACLPSEIGGRLNLLAHDMFLTFHRPVYTGDTITCEVTITQADYLPTYVIVSASCFCVNQQGKVVMSATFHGKQFLKEDG